MRPRPPSISILSLAIAAIALAFTPVPLHSASTDLPDPATQPSTLPAPQDVSLAALLQDLHAPACAQREQATATLLLLSPERLTDIEIALARETDAEAIGRLQQVALHLFLKKQTSFRGALSLLGIQFQVELLPLDPASREFVATIVVADIKPGFPAAETLKIGDHIIALDGDTFPVNFSSEDFPLLVNQHRPGEFLHTTILRNGQAFKADIRLAGIPENTTVTGFVEQRSLDGARYLAQLQMGRPATPLVLPDNSSPAISPDDIEIHDGF